MEGKLEIKAKTTKKSKKAYYTLKLRFLFNYFIHRIEKKYIFIYV